MNIASREIRLASRPVGTPTRENFKLEEVKLSILAGGHVPVRNLLDVVRSPKLFVSVRTILGAESRRLSPSLSLR